MAVERCKQSCQQDPHSFPNFLHNGATYVMYTHCFIDKYPHAKDDTTCEIQDNAQREDSSLKEGIDYFIFQMPRKKRRSNTSCKDVSITGFD